MLDHVLIEDDKLLILTPLGPLEASDFKGVADEVDGFIEEHGQLDGVMIEAESFPGWSNFSALLAHFRFVRDHHRKLCKVAVVSDDRVLTIFPNVAAHFVAAEVRHFPFAEKLEALKWLRDQQTD